MQIKSITIEGLHNVYQPTTYDFKQITTIFGTNGSGKSTILQAIQYALLGYIPGTNKNKSAIFEHANSDILDVYLVLSDSPIDITISRKLIRKGSKIDEIFNIYPETFELKDIINSIELPIFNTQDFYGLTSNMMKTWFIDFMPSDDAILDWNVLLQSCLIDNDVTDFDSSKYVDKIKSTISLENSLSTQIKSINDMFKDELSWEKKNLQRLENTIQSLVLYDDVDPLDDIDEVESEIAAFKQQRDEALIMDSKNKELSNLLHKKETIKLQLDEISEDFRTFDDFKIHIENQIHDLEEQKRTIASKKVKLEEDIVNTRIEFEGLKKSYESSGICPIDSKPCNRLLSHKNDAKLKYELLNNQISILNADKFSIDDQFSNVSMELNKLLDKKLHFNSLISTFEDVVDRIKELSDSINVDFVDLNFLDNSIAELESKKVKILSNQQYEKLSETLLKDKLSIEKEINVLKLFINLTGVNGLQSKYAKSGVFNKLEAVMDSDIRQLFGNLCNVKFNVTEKANSFSFGILRDDDYISYDMLSSGEKCLFSICLLTTIVRYSDTSLKLIMIDDMLDHIDSDNLSKLMMWIQNNKDVQYIFASVENINNSILDADNYTSIHVFS